MKIEVSVLGDTVISRRFLNIAENAGDLSSSWRVILDQFEEWTSDQFSTAGATFGTPWEPLAQSTLERKAAQGWPSDILVATGALRDSFAGGAGHVRKIGPESAEWGSTDEKAMFHHGRERTGNLPRRPLFELDEVRRRYVMSVIQRGVFGREPARV